MFATERFGEAHHVIGPFLLLFWRAPAHNLRHIGCVTITFCHFLSLSIKVFRSSAAVILLSVLCHLVMLIHLALSLELLFPGPAGIRKLCNYRK